MKNGPVFITISMINKCFSDIGSPLPYSMILDYLCMNCPNGRGINENEATIATFSATDAYSKLQFIILLFSPSHSYPSGYLQPTCY